MTTNFELWSFVTKDLGAPPVFLQFAFYAGVSIALERRVFYGTLDRPLFVNNYTLLVGPAAVGKGQSLREMRSILRLLPRTDAQGNPVVDRKSAGEFVPLFHALPDTSTFEQIVADMAMCRVSIKRPDDGTIYEHASGYLALEELSSLLRLNKADDVARLLLNLYDCEEFSYHTKKSGCYKIRNGCFNLLAGTTVDFLAKAEQNGLVGEGLTSRMLIVHADRRPFDKFEQNSLSPEQLEARQTLAKHFYRLGHLFGQIRYGPGCLEWLEEWWTEEYKHLSILDTRLQNYFSRRKLAMLKLAAAVHFSESFELEIKLPTFQFVAKQLRLLEDPVIQLARRAGRNVSYGVVERFLNRLERVKRMSIAEVIEHLSSDMQMPEITETLVMLQESKQLVRTIDSVIWTPKTPNSGLPSGANVSL